jgi:hypothetical protein
MHFMQALIVATLLMGVGAASATASPSPGNLAEELYHASSAASGSRLCDRKRAARLQEKFDQRFGERIRALIKVHESQFGKDPDFIILTSCLHPGKGYNQSRALKEFEPRLRELEKKYGGY